MPRFFSENIADGKAVIQGEDAGHIAKVLRMSVGEELTLCDMNGSDYSCVIESVQPKEVQLRVTEKLVNETEPTVRVKLFMALPKADKMEFIVQKAVELGVDEVTPVYTHRCVSRPDAKSMENKIQRYNRVALEAAKQSGRGKVPKVLSAVDFKTAIAQMKNSGKAVLFYEKSSCHLAESIADNCGEISVMIGAEGGFEQSEVDYAAGEGVPSATLGKRILRCETAPLAALSLIMYITGNME